MTIGNLGVLLSTEFVNVSVYLLIPGLDEGRTFGADRNLDLGKLESHGGGSTTLQARYQELGKPPRRNGTASASAHVPLKLARRQKPLSRALFFPGDPEG